MEGLRAGFTLGCLIVLGLARATGQEPAIQTNPQTESSASTKLAAEPATYAAWIEPYRHDPLHIALGFRQEAILRITQIEGDDVKRDTHGDASANLILSQMFSPVLYRGVTVAVDGGLSGFANDASESRGGGGGYLAWEDLQELRRLIAALPDDHANLPPPGRRMVVQAESKAGVVARVYDRANLPEQILAMLRLTEATGMGPIVLRFDAPKKWERWWNTGAPNLIGVEKSELPYMMLGSDVLAASDDRTWIVKQAQTWAIHRPVQIVNRAHECDPTGYSVLPSDKTAIQVLEEKTNALVHEIDEPIIGRCWVEFDHGWFSPNRRYLILLDNLIGIRAYETTTWEQVSHVPGMPDDAIAYFPSVDWTHGVYVAHSGEIRLWDAAAQTSLALPTAGEELLQSVSFSPDGSRIAVVSVGRRGLKHRTTAHLRIVETNTGNLVRELMPMEHFTGSMGDPMWLPNSKYMLAETRDDSFSSASVVGIWNLETGRYRGSFWGCFDSNDSRRQFVIKGDRLIWQCGNDILEWNLADAIRKIHDFDQSLIH